MTGKGRISVKRDWSEKGANKLCGSSGAEAPFFLVGVQEIGIGRCQALQPSRIVVVKAEVWVVALKFHLCSIKGCLHSQVVQSGTW